MKSSNVNLSQRFFQSCVVAVVLIASAPGIKAGGDMPTVISPQIVLGLYGISPWVTNNNFADPTASWVYSFAGAQNGAAFDTYTKFQTIYTHLGNASMTASLFVAADNSANVHVNGVNLGDTIYNSCGAPGVAMSVLLFPGDNVIDFMHYNGETFFNPAGLIYSLIDSNTNKVLIHSGPMPVTRYDGMSSSDSVCVKDYVVPVASTTSDAKWEAADWSTLRALPFVYVMPTATASIAACISYVSKLPNSKDLNYAGVEDGNNCWYGPKMVDYSKFPAVDARLCNIACPAAFTQNCGGLHTLHVYKIIQPAIPAVWINTN